MAIFAMGSVQAADNATDVSDFNVTFDTQMYEEDLGYIEVEVPQNASGNLRATINDVEFYNENISGDVKIPVSIPDKARPLIVPNKITDHTSYSIYLFFNNIELKSDHVLNVMKYPPNYEIPGFPEEILQHDESAYQNLLLPELINGTLDLYIDGEFLESVRARQFTILNSTQFTSLALGNHTLRVVFGGDSYYKKFDKTFNFSVVDMTIQIPQRIFLEHDDCIVAKTIAHTGGVVTVYVDNVSVFKDSLDKDGEFLHSMFDDITCGEHLIEVKYVSGNFTKSKKALVNVDYELDDIGYGSYRYGENVEISLIFPSDAKKQFVRIALNGVEIKDFTIDESGWIDLDLQKLDEGNYTLEYAYIGDKKYYDLSQSYNFTVSYKIDYPFWIFDDGDQVSLTLPNGASGNLEVYLNDTLYKSLKLVDGDAVIVIKNIKPGKYDLTARYTGSDYHVNDIETRIVIDPKYSAPYEVVYGEEKYITLTASGNVNANATFTIDSKNYTVAFKNGKAKLSLKNFKIGEYDVDVTYVDDSGFVTHLYSYFDVVKPTVKIKNVKSLYSQNAKVKVYVAGKLAKNTNIAFKVGKKTFKVKTNKKGVATLKTSKLTPGKYSIVASYLGAKSVKKLTVKHMVSLSKVKVKKSAKKIILKAKLSKKLKNKVIKFKFNGKTLKAKTNSIGIAKVTFKHLKIKSNRITYSAAYLKDTVKRTVKVAK